MWILVMFDLPVGTKQERRAAHDFRLALLDLGFEMAQFSVYLRFCSSHAQCATQCRYVEAALPVGGRVSVLQFTDKQYERTVTFSGRKPKKKIEAPPQYVLF